MRSAYVAELYPYECASVYNLVKLREYFRGHNLKFLWRNVSSNEVLYLRIYTNGLYLMVSAHSRKKTGTPTGPLLCLVLKIISVYYIYNIVRILRTTSFEAIIWTVREYKQKRKYYLWINNFYSLYKTNNCKILEVISVIFRSTITILFHT